MDERKKKAALALKKDSGRSVKEICEIVGISRNTYYKYTRADGQPEPGGKSPASGRPEGPGEPKAKECPSTHRPTVAKVTLRLRVENNSKFVRGKGKVREEIERYVLSRFAMQKADQKGCEYLLSVPYTSDEELDRTIYEEICAEAERYADLRHCFIEADISSADDPEKSW